MPYFLIGSYTPAALQAPGKKPSNRVEAAEKLITSAGGTLISFYRTTADGPGIHIIYDADPISADAINTVAVAGGALTNVRAGRLWTDDEVSAIPA